LGIRDGTGLITLRRGEFFWAISKSAVSMEVRITKADNFAEYIDSPSADLTIMDVGRHELNVLSVARRTV